MTILTKLKLTLATFINAISDAIKLPYSPEFVRPNNQTDILREALNQKTSQKIS